MSIDEIYEALRRVMRDLQLPDRDMAISLYPDPHYPTASVAYLCPARNLPSIDMADPGSGIPVYRTTEGPLRITIQAEPEVAA